MTEIAKRNSKAYDQSLEKDHAIEFILNISQCRYELGAFSPGVIEGTCSLNEIQGFLDLARSRCEGHLAVLKKIQRWKLSLWVTLPFFIGLGATLIVMAPHSSDENDHMLIFGKILAFGWLPLTVSTIFLLNFFRRMHEKVAESHIKELIEDEREKWASRGLRWTFRLIYQLELWLDFKITRGEFDQKTTCIELTDTATTNIEVQHGLVLPITETLQ